MAHPLEDPRFARLFRELRVDYSTPFVLRGPAAKQVEAMHYGAGRDASYVIVQRLKDADPVAAVGVVTIDPKNIPGTTIIYDVTAEALQGKARPFSCDLKSTASRVYAILPYQVEDINLSVEKNESAAVRVRVACVDARGERLRAALPFVRWKTNSLGVDYQEQFCTTDRDGTYSQWLTWGPGEGGKSWAVSVRSLLTGRTKSVKFEKKV